MPGWNDGEKEGKGKREQSNNPHVNRNEGTNKRRHEAREAAYTGTTLFR